MCREEVAPLRGACPGGIGEAVVAMARRNNAPTPPRPVGSRLRCQRRVWELLYRSTGPVLHRLGQVMLLLLLASFLFDAELLVGDVDGGRLDRARSSLGGGSRRWHARIQGLEGAPVVARSLMTTSCSVERLSTSTPSKALARWGSSSSWRGSGSISSAAAGAKVLGISL